MKPIDQTKFGGVEGNCFSACVASMFELPLERVPFFMVHGDKWYSVFAEWLGHRGEYPVCLPLRDEWRPTGLYILSGTSPRGSFLHSVVARGHEIVHDPHPSRAGLLSIVDAIMIVRIDPMNENKRTIDTMLNDAQAARRQRASEKDEMQREFLRGKVDALEATALMIGEQVTR